MAAALLRVAAGAEPSSLPTPARWTQWTWFAQRQRVVPLLYHLARQNPVELEREQAKELRTIQGDAMVWAVRLEHALLQTTELFDLNGVKYAVLKGMATAHLDYPSPAWRQFGDIDLLVAPDAFTAAIRLLETVGWAQGYELPRGHRRFTHAVTLTKQGIELDIHQHVAHRAIGLLVPTGALLERRRAYRVAGRQLWALCDEDRLVHAALHAHLSRGATKRLSSVADVLMMAERWQPRADKVLGHAAHWSVGNLVHASVVGAYQFARIEVPSTWTDSGAALARASWVERAHLNGGRPVQMEMAYLSQMGGWSDRIGYIRGHLSGTVGQRGVRTTRDRLRYLWTKARSRTT